jgi:hypothetical protein
MKYYSDLIAMESVMIDLACHVSLLQAYTIACENGLKEMDRADALHIITDSIKRYSDALLDMHGKLFEIIREDTHEQPAKGKKGCAKGKDKV